MITELQKRNRIRKHILSLPLRTPGILTTTGTLTTLTILTVIRIATGPTRILHIAGIIPITALVVILITTPDIAVPTMGTGITVAFTLMVLEHMVVMAI